MYSSCSCITSHSLLKIITSMKLCTFNTNGTVQHLALFVIWIYVISMFEIYNYELEACAWIETNRSKCFKEYKCHKRKFQCLYCIISIIGDEKHKEYIYFQYLNFSIESHWWNVTILLLKYSIVPCQKLPDSFSSRAINHLNKMLYDSLSGGKTEKICQQNLDLISVYKFHVC